MEPCLRRQGKGLASRLKPEVLAMIPVARLVLMTGRGSQKPSLRAVLKTVAWLQQSPLHALAKPHVRGSWRSWRLA